jgi:outer membrane protein assembly factor BamB
MSLRSSNRTTPLSSCQLRWHARRGLGSATLYEFLLISVSLISASAAATADPLDWPNWRGPQQNRVSMEKGLVDKWSPEGGEASNVLWSKKELGGRSTPIVMRGKLYTITHDKPETAVEGEKVVCVDAATGKPIWEHRFNVSLSDAPAERIGWSSVAGDPETGRVYAQGLNGYFCCLEGETGKLVWDHALHEEYGTISTYGGRTNVPVVFEDNLLISAVMVGWGDEPKWGRFAIPAHRFMCFNKATGELRWINGTSPSPYDTTFSTPTCLPVGGLQQLIFCSGDGGVWSLQPRTGKVVWNYPFGRAGMNVSPLVTAEGQVFANHGVENTEGTSMGAVVALDGTKTGNLAGKELWKRFEVLAPFSSPVMLDDRLYVIDDSAKMTAFDAKTGEVVAKKKLGSVMRGTGDESPTPFVADGKIYAITGDGQWYVLKPNEKEIRVLSKLRLTGEAVNASPIVSHGRIYVTTMDNMYCIGTADQKPEADPLPTWPKETPGDLKVAQVQLVPYDVVLSPGKKQEYKIRVFNAKGQLLPESVAKDAKFTVDGHGKIGANGMYTAPKENEHQCALVTCKLGQVSGTARIRVIPPLPWKFDFNRDKNVPLTWLGGRIRWEVREQDGDKFIAKKSVLPTPKDPHNKLGSRSFLWMGPTDLANYTIQADMLVKQEGGKMPDAGIIAGGYELTIRSQNHKLRLDSWASNNYRSLMEVPFEPQPDKWYTLKLSVAPENASATVRGKIWARGEREPDKWTLEIVDKSPNLSGTPAIYGNSADAEIYLDNLKVTPNQLNQTF